MSNKNDKMKVLLIYPVFNLKKTYGILKSYVYKSIPLGLGYMIGKLLNEKIDVDFIDEQIETIDFDNVEKLVKEKQIRIIGISVLTRTIARAYKISRELKRRIPDIVIVFGGVHATILPYEPFKYGADFVIRGEGEEVFTDFVKKIYNGENYKEVKNLTYFDSNENRFIDNEIAPLVDLNLLPEFPYDFFYNYSRTYHFGMVIVTRGCPYNCIFCSQRSISGKKYRTLSPNRVIDILDRLIVKYHSKDIYFADDNFVANRKWTKEVLRLIREKKYSTKK